MLNYYYVSEGRELDQIERETGYVSYRRVIEENTDGLVLCNNIINIDESVYYNMEGCEDLENVEIYQYFLANLNEYERENLKSCGVILSYSDMLDLDVICVDHWGSSWSIVPCDVKITNDWELYKKNNSLWND